MRMVDYFVFETIIIVSLGQRAAVFGAWNVVKKKKNHQNLKKNS